MPSSPGSSTASSLTYIPPSTTFASALTVGMELQEVYQEAKCESSTKSRVDCTSLISFQCSNALPRSHAGHGAIHCGVYAPDRATCSRLDCRPSVCHMSPTWSVDPKDVSFDFDAAYRSSVCAGIVTRYHSRSPGVCRPRTGLGAYPSLSPAPPPPSAIADATVHVPVHKPVRNIFNVTPITPEPVPATSCAAFIHPSSNASAPEPMVAVDTPIVPVHQYQPDRYIISALESRIRELELDLGDKSGKIYGLESSLDAVSGRIARLESLIRPVPPPQSATLPPPPSSTYARSHSHISAYRPPDASSTSAGYSFSHLRAPTYSPPVFPPNLADQTFSSITDISFGSSSQG